VQEIQLALIQLKGSRIEKNEILVRMVKNNSNEADKRYFNKNSSFENVTMPSSFMCEQNTFLGAFYPK